MENKDAKLCLGQVLATTHSLTSSLDILLELLDGVFKSGSGIIDLVDNEDALADQVLHLTEGSKVEPLGTGDLFANLLDLGILTEGLVQRQANSLNGDVGKAGLLEERSQDTGGDVAAAADGNHELGLELTQKTVGRLLAQLVDLERRASWSASLSQPKLVCLFRFILSMVWHNNFRDAQLHHHVSIHTYIIVGDVNLLDVTHGGGLYGKKYEEEEKLVGVSQRFGVAGGQGVEKR